MKIWSASLLLAGLFLPLAAAAAPATGGANATPVDRSKPPAISQNILSTRMPDYTEYKLDNGIPVYCVSSRRVPLTHLMLVFRDCGSKSDPVGKYGLASLTMDMMDEGVGDMDALEFSKAQDMLGADISCAATWDSVGFTASFLTDRHDEVRKLFGKLVTQPTFPENELQRLKKETVDGLNRARSDANTIAKIEFNRLVFGEDSRYGTLRVGTAAQVQSLTRQDLIDFYKWAIRPEKAFLVVGGNFDPKVLIPRLNEEIGKWKSKEPEVAVQPGTPEPPIKVTERIVPATLTKEAEELAKKELPKCKGVYLVDRPGAHQTVIRVGSLGITANDPDDLIAEALNTVLGGSFTSRLNINLREKNGYTYGATSGFDRRKDRGAFVIATSVQTDKTMPAMKEIVKELVGIRQPIPNEELTRAKNYMAYTFPSLFETGGNMTTTVTRLINYDMPRDYVQTFIPKVQKITSDEVNRVAERLLKAKETYVVMVGDAKALEPQLKSSGVQAHVLSVDDVMGPKVEVK